MDFKVYKIETYGMKNIENPMSIEFYPKTIGKTSKKLSNIKAIYGTNGAGKSAFINSVFLYKKISTKNLFLKQSNEIKTLNKILNQAKKEFYFSIIFSVSSKNEEIYKHEIKIELENEVPYISLERISKSNSKTINGTFEMIVESLNGELTLTTKKKTRYDNFLLDKTKNMLKYTTLSSLISEKEFLDKIVECMDSNNENEVIPSLGSFHYLILNRLLVESVVVHLDIADIHSEFDDEAFNEIINEYFNNKERFEMIITGSNKDRISKNYYPIYEKNIKKLCEFLKIFKTDLIDIVIERQEDKEQYYCTKKLIYDNHKIDSEYESTGIKKMMNIFGAIEAVTKGKIVFIDELDSNVSGVYLNKLLEYLNDSKKGQLCFTTHNLYPMEYLCDFSNSIDFIGETGKIVSWIKNGNYRPYKLYPEGMIPDSPFNIESFDFARVFEAED